MWLKILLFVFFPCFTINYQNRANYTIGKKMCSNITINNLEIKIIFCGNKFNVPIVFFLFEYKVCDSIFFSLKTKLKAIEDIHRDSEGSNINNHGNNCMKMQTFSMVPSRKLCSIPFIRNILFYFFQFHANIHWFTRNSRTFIPEINIGSSRIDIMWF